MGGSKLYIPSSDCMMGRILIIGRIRGREVRGHAGQRLEAGVGRGHGAPPVAVLVSK